MDAVVDTALARLVDVAITTALTNIGRGPVVERVDALAKDGQTPDQITDNLQAWAAESAKKTQQDIDNAPA